MSAASAALYAGEKGTAYTHSVHSPVTPVHHLTSPLLCTLHAADRLATVSSQHITAHLGNSKVLQVFLARIENENNTSHKLLQGGVLLRVPSQSLASLHLT